ncbi:MAG: AraC family transcriptional regulator [Clostridiales bacterium]|nr:AraC family transcriptional regulator [Clostridiales bacterium]
MDWLDRFNEAINYIEEHLEENINLDDLGKIACCSSYHFQRMFSYMADVPLAEYIRRRRMSLAAVDLRDGQKVIDVALKYGYESPTSFNRAFQSIHGFAPSKMKSTEVSIKAYPPISFQITIKGAVEMSFRIVEKKAFRIIGVSIPLEKELEKNFAAVPQFWGKVSASGIIPKLVPLMEEEPKGLLGVTSCGGSGAERYYIGVTSNQPLPEGMEEYTVPAETWAVFAGQGPMPDSIQSLEKQIVTEWLPTSGYEYADAPDIEVYLDANPANAKFEVWLPVVKK